MVALGWSLNLLSEMVHAALNAALSPDASVRVPAEQVCVFSSFFPFFFG